MPKVISYAGGNQFLSLTRAILIVIVLFVATTTHAILPAPPLELFTINGQGGYSSVNSVTPIDADNIYLVASGDQKIAQDTTLLSAMPGGGTYFSIIKKQLYGAGVSWTRDISSAVYIWDTELMPDGGLVICGTFFGTVTFPSSGPGITKRATGSKDFFVARYLPDGTLAWVQTGGSFSDDDALAIAVDKSGNLVIAGGVGPNAVVNGISIPSAGLYIARYTADGTFDWIRSVSGGISHGHGLAVDSNGDYYVSGYFKGTVTIGSTQLQSDGSSSPSEDALLVKYNPQGDLLWCRQGGGVGDDMFTKVRRFGTDGVVCVGIFNAQAKFGTNNTINAAGTGSLYDAFVTRVSADGDWLWARSLNGTETDVPNGVGVDSSGNIYIGGYFNKTLQLVTTNLNAFDLTSGLDSFITRFNPQGAADWAIKLTGLSRQNINNLIVNDSDRIFFWGDYDDRIVYDTVTYNEPYSVGNNGFYGTIALPLPPRILTQPVNSGGLLGSTVTLSVVAGGLSPYSYQWVKDGTNIVGATGATFTINSLAAKDIGDYKVIVGNVNGVTVSDTVKVDFSGKPSFLVQPQNVGREVGGKLTITPSLLGVPTPTLTWSRLGGPTIYTGPALAFSNLQPSDEGFYTVTAANTEGSVSATFWVGVNTIPSDSFTAFVHDPFRDVVYLTSGYQVLRFSMASKTFLTPLSLGGVLSGLDLSGDGKYLVVGDSTSTGANNGVFVVNLETGQIRKDSFAAVAGEGGIESVAFETDTRVLVSSNKRLRSYDVVSKDLVSSTATATYQLGSSAGRQTIGLGAKDAGLGQVKNYSVAQRNLTADVFADGRTLTDIAVSPAGDQLAAVSAGKAVFLGANLQILQTVGDGVTSGPMGAVYHPQQNLVYLPWLQTTEVRAYSTVTLTEVSRFSAGTTNYAPGAANPVGQARLSRSGETLFVTGPFGIRYISLPSQPPVILAQPTPNAASPTKTGKFSVKAYSASLLGYQWQKDGVDIPGANAPDYFFTAGAGSLGNYRVAVSNATGIVYSTAASFTLLKNDPGLVWNNPADITYGTPLAVSHLNATADVGGTYAYTPPLGTVLNAGIFQPLQVVFTPTDLSTYERATNVVQINVLKRAVTVGLSNTNRQYGLPDPVFATTYAGFLAGESVNDLDLLPVASSTATETSPVGTYPISLSGGSDDNYYYQFGTATLTVTKRTVAYTLNNLNQPYTGTPRPVTVTTVPDGVPLVILYNGSSTAPTALGSYPVSVSSSNPNYQGTASGTLVIGKGTATITWGPLAPITYGTALSATQLSASANINGIYSYSPASGTVPGAGNQTLTLVFTPLDSVNYVRSTNTVSLQVNPATLTATIQNASRAYGVANPAFSGSLSGLVGSDNITAQYSSTANLTSPVGSYNITPVFTDPGNKLANYTVATVGGVLSVTKATLTIKANDASRNYGQTNPVFTAQFTGLKNSDVIPVSFNTTATPASTAGTYPINVALANPPAANYDVTLQSGTLTVTLDPNQIITFVAQPLSYTEASGTQILDPAALVANVPDMTNARLTLRILSNTVDEQLGLLAEGSANGQVDLAADKVRHSGVEIGTLSGSGTEASPLVVQFNANVTLGKATDVLRRISYANASHNPAALARTVEATLLDINGALSTPAQRAIQITAVNDAPVVTWVAPVAGASLKAGYPVVLEASATDVDNAVSKVEYWAGANKLGEVLTAPYRFTWMPTSLGQVDIKAYAYDAAGLVSVEAVRSFMVNPAMISPRFTTPGQFNEFRFEFSGVNGQEYQVEVSSDLINWTPLSSFTGSGGSSSISDGGTVGMPRRFYRIVPKP